ncbi:MAG: CHAP domain-containing protein [Candidatus Saccharimonas sp.]
MGHTSHNRRQGAISGASIASYLGVFLLVITLVMLGYQPPVRQTALAESGTSPSSSSANTSSATSSSTGMVDQLTATNLASSLAASTDMPISNDVASLSQSLTVESQLSQTDTNVISKPQVVNASADTRTTKHYTTIAGDTVQNVAQRYNVTANTIKWANNLTSDALEAGKTLTIPPVDGIIYTVKSGDTLNSIASKYKSERALIVTFNDLEASGEPAVGRSIIIPQGQLPSNEQPGYVAPITRTNGITYSTYSGGSASLYSGGISSGNKYSYGQCTWYAYERRMQLGMPVGGMWGNAYSWAYMAQAAGYQVDGNPTAGSVMQNSGGYGHVAVVESVNPGVSVTISEMNAYRFGGGWNRVGRGDISWSEATSGYYKYIH